MFSSVTPTPSVALTSSWGPNLIFMHPMKTGMLTGEAELVAPRPATTAPRGFSLSTVLSPLKERDFSRFWD